MYREAPFLDPPSLVNNLPPSRQLAFTFDDRLPLAQPTSQQLAQSTLVMDLPAPDDDDDAASPSEDYPPDPDISATHEALQHLAKVFDPACTGAHVSTHKYPHLSLAVRLRRRRSEVDKWVDNLPQAVKDRLQHRTGKLYSLNLTSNIIQSFYSPPQARHMLLLVLKYGYLDDLDALDGQDTWAWMAQHVPDVQDFRDLVQEFGSIDFNPLQGYPVAWDHETDINMNRANMTTAAILYFEGDMERVVNFVGGPHVAAHRNVPLIIAFLRGKIPTPLVEELENVFLFGLPQRCVATSSEENFQTFFRYGNHKSCLEDDQKTRDALIKDNKRGYTLLFDQRALKFLLHAHVTPQGITDLDHPIKEPRPFFDASFRPSHTAMALNDWIDTSTEPVLTFMRAELEFMKWLNALRVAFPTEEIYLGDDDVSGAHRQVKYAPNLVAMHASTQCGLGVVNTGAAFGDKAACANFEPIARARAALAQWFFYNLPDVVDVVQSYLPELRLAAPPTSAEVASFTLPADLDSQNPSVFCGNACRRANSYLMYCDDCPCADTAEHMLRSVACSVLAIYVILGFPHPLVPPPIGRKKLDTWYTHQRKWLGRLWDSRTLSIEMLPYKRDQLVTVLKAALATTRGLKIKELARIVGMIENHVRYSPRFRPWYFALQNELNRILRARFFAIQRIWQKHGVAAKLEAQLPSAMMYRLSGICSQEMAQAMWGTRETVKLSPRARQELRHILCYITSDPHPFREYIPLIIPRDPQIESWGDASTGDGAGAICPTLRVWLDLGWSAEIKSHLASPANPKGTIHINHLEFVTVILQAAAIRTCLDTYTTEELARAFPAGVPPFPAWKCHSDNTASIRWGNALSAHSAVAQDLLVIYGDLLGRCQFNTSCEHVPGKDNVIADFISRQSFSQPLPVRAAQLYRNHSSLSTWNYFHPSPSFLQLLTSALCSSLDPQSRKIPRNLGHIERELSTSSCGPN